MLKNISPLLSPELLQTLAAMGHGDEIVLADSNFPAASHASRLVRADGHKIPELLAAILQLFPLDTFVDNPAAVMQPVDDSASEPAVWSDYRRVMDAAEQREISLSLVERYQFYDRARTAYAIVATGETALYGNLILKKGVITES
ncbi:MAG: L-fucose mutarotase [Planctomycetaceae bacterium]|jgi:L-fucose mutarotase|nr:L-fucose mutarotase [Planctomycetaceae bacterium]MDG2387978.1 L-fucose mutarotase [Planctomycetaceae bacterium]